MDILPHLRLDAAATRQKHAVRRDRSGHVVHHGAGTLPVPAVGRRDTAQSSLQSDSYHGVRCRAIRVTVLGVRRFRSLESSCRKWSGAASGPCAGRGPTRAPNSGDDTSLRVVAPAPHHRIYKRMGRGAVAESSSFLSRSSVVRVSSFLLIAPVC